jgi:hypothetical protein
LAVFETLDPGGGVAGTTAPAAAAGRAALVTVAGKAVAVAASSGRHSDDPAVQRRWPRARHARPVLVDRDSGRGPGVPGLSGATYS